MHVTVCSSYAGQHSFSWILKKKQLLSASVLSSIFPEGVLDGLLPPLLSSPLLPESQTGEYSTPSADADRPTLKAGQPPMIHRWQITETRGES